MVSKALQRESLLRQLRDNETFSIVYRLMIEGKAVYHTMRILRDPSDEEDSLILGVLNVDSSVRTEQSTKTYNAIAKTLANRYATIYYVNLSSNHYVEYSSSNDYREVCDVNGLKAVNDNLGHIEGDAYIRSASQLICKTWAHSPVFRIGGDEFVVVLEGSDYQNREALITRIKAQVMENKREGNVVVAAGMSDFDPTVDETVGAVFDRADAQMYENKQALKR